jgi:hypothetical protein
MTTENTMALQVRSVADLQAIGEGFERSGIFGCTQHGQGLVLAMTCVSEGMSPLKFSQTYHIIQGRVTMKADAMLARFVERGGRYKIVARTPERAAIEMEKDKNKQVFEFSWTDAQKEPFVYQKNAKTLKTNWASPRSRMQMLWARLTSDAVRAMDPGVNCGAYTPEEVADDDTPTPVMPTSVSPAPMTATTVASTTNAPAPEKKPDAVTPEVLPPVEKDPTVVPAGAKSGKKWDTLSDKALAVAVKWEIPQMTDAHRAEVQKVIDARAKAVKS